MLSLTLLVEGVRIYSLFYEPFVAHRFDSAFLSQLQKIVIFL